MISTVPNRRSNSISSTMGKAWGWSTVKKTWQGHTNHPHAAKHCAGTTTHLLHREFLLLLAPLGEASEDVVDGGCRHTVAQLDAHRLCRTLIHWHLHLNNVRVQLPSTQQPAKGLHHVLRRLCQIHNARVAEPWCERWSRRAASLARHYGATHVLAAQNLQHMLLCCGLHFFLQLLLLVLPSEIRRHLHQIAVPGRA